MMTELLESSTFTVPLDVEAHRLAQQFGRQQNNQKKAKQVYLNTLAVSAVKFYLHCMGIETNWSASSSWNPVMRLLMDVADLEIPSLGKLECLPVLPEAQIVTIPPEVWSERIGYIAVQLDSTLQSATLLGFTKTIPESGELPISQLQSLADLLEHLRQIRQPEPLETRINLSQWFENLFEAGWRSLETLLENSATDKPNLAFGLMSNSQLREISIKGAKLIDLGLPMENQSVVLVVRIARATDTKVSILVQLHPIGQELPPNVKLALLSESGKILQEVQSLSQDNFIQLKTFRGLFGECFNIKIAFGETSVTENFII